MWVHFSLSRTPWAAFSGSKLAMGFVRLDWTATIALLVLLMGAPSSRGQDKRGTAILEKDGESAVTNGNYYALVIGIDEYPSPLPSLKTAVADARAVSSLLSQAYGFQVQLLLNRDATRAHILDAITQYRNTLSPNDNLLIYYAGHGYSDHDADKAYWLPADADSSFSANRIIADDLTTGVRVLPARHVLVISDSCYSGALTRDADAPTWSGGQAALIDKMLRSRSRTLMASGGDEPVSDAGTGGHSVFAYALLRALEQANGQMFTAGEMFYRSVRAQVAGKSEQLPEYSVIRNSSHDEGDFVFSRNTTHGAIVHPAIDAPTPKPLMNNTPATVPGRELSNPVLQTTADCTSATAEALKLSLRGQNLARVTQNLRCRPENVNDEQSQAVLAELFDRSRFSASRGFLDEIWKIPSIASVDPCPLAHTATYSANFEGLAWLSSRAESEKLRQCRQFDGDLVEALFLVGKEHVPIAVSQLETGGLSLEHDQYSLFRIAYESYVGTGYPGYQWVSDAFAPPTAAAFGEAKARAEAHLVSTSTLFTEAGSQPEQALGVSYQKSRELIQKRMSEYCPRAKGYCPAISPPAESHARDVGIHISQGEFIDQVDKLMWTAKASDLAANWAAASDYCKNLTQAGYHDWRLPQLEELLKLVDTSQAVVSACKRPDGETPTFHVKQGIDPGCGDVWSNTKSQRILRMGGFTFQYAWLFDFSKGSSVEDPTDWLGNATAYHHRMLCVRGLR